MGKLMILHVVILVLSIILLSNGGSSYVRRLKINKGGRSIRGYTEVVGPIIQNSPQNPIYAPTSTENYFTNSPNNSPSGYSYDQTTEISTSETQNITEEPTSEDILNGSPTQISIESETERSKYGEKTENWTSGQQAHEKGERNIGENWTGVQHEQNTEKNENSEKIVGEDWKKFLHENESPVENKIRESGENWNKAHQNHEEKNEESAKLNNGENLNKAQNHEKNEESVRFNNGENWNNKHQEIQVENKENWSMVKHFKEDGQNEVRVIDQEQIENSPTKVLYGAPVSSFSQSQSLANQENSIKNPDPEFEQFIASLQLPSRTQYEERKRQMEQKTQIQPLMSQFMRQEPQIQENNQGYNYQNSPQNFNHEAQNQFTSFNQNGLNSQNFEKYQENKIMPQPQPQPQFFSPQSNIQPISQNKPEEEMTLDGLNNNIVDSNLLDRVQQIIEAHERQQREVLKKSRSMEPVDNNGGYFSANIETKDNAQVKPHVFSSSPNLEFQQAVLSGHFTESNNLKSAPKPAPIQNNGAERTYLPPQKSVEFKINEREQGEPIQQNLPQNNFGNNFRINEPVQNNPSHPEAPQNNLQQQHLQPQQNFYVPQFRAPANLGNNNAHVEPPQNFQNLRAGYERAFPEANFIPQPQAQNSVEPQQNLQNLRSGYERAFPEANFIPQSQAHNSIEPPQNFPNFQQVRNNEPTNYPQPNVLTRTIVIHEQPTPFAGGYSNRIVVKPEEFELKNEGQNKYFYRVTDGPNNNINGRNNGNLGPNQGYEYMTVGANVNFNSEIKTEPSSTYNALGYQNNEIPTFDQGQNIDQQELKNLERKNENIAIRPIYGVPIAPVLGPESLNDAVVVEAPQNEPHFKEQSPEDRNLFALYRLPNNNGPHEQNNGNFGRNENEIQQGYGVSPHRRQMIQGVFHPMPFY